MASELPRIAKGASMDPNYRSAYCTASNGGGNLKTVYGERFPSEPIFVQRPDRRHRRMTVSSSTSRARTESSWHSTERALRRWRGPGECAWVPWFVCRGGLRSMMLEREPMACYVLPRRISKMKYRTKIISDSVNSGIVAGQYPKYLESGNQIWDRTSAMHHQNDISLRPRKGNAVNITAYYWSYDVCG